MAKKKEEEEKRALIEAQVRTGLDKKEGQHTYMSVQNPSVILSSSAAKEREGAESKESS